MIAPSPDRLAQKRAAIEAAAARRILVLDGAMGTMFQRLKLQEADFRGTLLKDHPADLKGNFDVLNLTAPERVMAIHRAYLSAGADIIETNTFNSTAISQAEYKLSHLSYDMNLAGARLARQVADEFTAQTPDKPRFVAGALGPTSRTASISPDVANPGYRNVEFDELRLAYKDAAAIVPESGPLFFDMLAAHLNPPWQILRIISAVMDKPNERYLSDSELSSFAERLMDAIDVSLKAITRMDLDGGGEAAIAAARAVELITQQTFELEVSIELSRDHGWGKRILDQKKTLANLVEARLKEAEKLVAAALPIQSDGFSRGRRSGPKLDAAPDGRAVGRALTVLKFVHDVRLCANYGGFSAMHAKVSDKLGQAIDAYVEDVLDHVRTGDVPDVSLAHDHLNVAADLIGLVRDDKATELVRRRAANACSTAKPAAGSGDSVVLDA